MRIGTDGTHLRGRWDGFHRYAEGMLRALAAGLPAGDELAVYYNALPSEPLFDPSVRERFVRMPRATLYSQVGLALRARVDRCDVFLGATQVVPVRLGPPSVLVVHDCLAFRHPEATPGRSGRFWRRWQPRCARAAARVVAVSRWSAEECERYLGVPADAVVVIPEGVDGRFRPASDAEVETDARLVHDAGLDGAFVLQVGGREAHKGGGVAADAVAALRRGGMAVLLARCGLGSQAGRDGDTVELGMVDERLLLALYRQATAVCVTSTHEGFGLPVVEAMAVGTPVVAADAAALPETAGGAALLVPPGDPGAVASAIARLLGSAEERQRWRDAGLARAAGLRWDVIARRMHQLLTDVAASR